MTIYLDITVLIAGFVGWSGLLVAVLTWLNRQFAQNRKLFYDLCDRTEQRVYWIELHLIKEGKFVPYMLDKKVKVS